MREKKELNFAQRWIDLLAKENRNSLILTTRVLILGIVSLLFLGGVGSTPWLWKYKVNRDISLVEDQIFYLRDIANQVNQLETLKAKVQGRQQLQTIMQNSTRDPAPILEKLKTTLPVGSVVNSFFFQENAVNLSISVPTPVDVARLWVSLRDSEMFQEVDIKTISLQDEAQTLNLNLRLNKYLLSND